MAVLSLSCWILMVLVVWWQGLEVDAQVQLRFQGATVVNHGFLTRGPIGTADGDTVMCVTDNTDCCTSAETGNGGVGNWFFPNGSSVQGNNAGTQFYFSRGPQVVRLHRRRAGVSGIYRCRIPDASGENQDLYVGIYTGSTGRPNITSIDFSLTSELNTQPPTFVLTCISGGGPVERVDWLIGGTVLQDGSNYGNSGPTVVDTEAAAIYHQTLTVTGRLPDTYTCRVFSTRPLTAGGIVFDTMNIDVVAADPPTMVSADQVNPESTTVRVTWTPPTGGATVTGYRIYYTGGSRDVEDGGATEDTLTLQDGTYTITMVARSQHLPSALSNSVTVMVTVVTVATPVIAMVQPTSPTSIMVEWTQQGEVDSFEIAYERVTGAMQQGPCPSVEDSDTVTVSDGIVRQQTVMGLEEFSTYSFTITAMADGGTSPPSGSMTATTEQAAPSGAPEAVRPMAVTSTSIIVAWDPVNCTDRNSEITQYTVRYGPESMPGNRVIVTVPGSGDAVGMYTISPLTPFTSYSIQVAAVNSGGQSGEFSDAIIVETEQDAPSRVRDLSATPNLISIAVSWSEPETLNGVITAYEVYYQQQGEQERELRNITDTTMTSTVLTGLRPETTYTISVSARTIAGPGEEVSIDRTTTSISRVVNLVATPGIVSIAVSWSTSGGSFGDITAYEVYYQRQGEQERELRNITDTSMTSTVLTGLRPETTYTISVRVYSIAGPGEEASTMATTTSIPRVQNLETDTGVTSIAVSWSVSSTEDITAYEVYFQQQGEQERELRNITDTSMTSTELTGLIPNTTYTISVRVYSIAGPGEETSTTATTTSIPAVQNVRVTSVSDTEVMVTWDTIAGVSRYIVFYSPVGNVRRQVPTEEEMVEVDMPPAMIGNLTTGVEYQFRAAAVVEVAGEILTGMRSILDDNSRVVAGESQGGGGGGGSNGGAIAGGVIGALAAVVLIAVGVVVGIWLWRRYQPGKFYRPSRSPPIALQPSSIRYEKEKESVKEEKFIGPMVMEFPADIGVTEGEGVIFQVKVSGVPSPTLVWYHNGNKVVADYSIELEVNGSLGFPSAESRHTGVYKLVASNSAGTTEREVRLDVYPEGDSSPTTERKVMDLQQVPVAKFGKYVAELHSTNNKGFRDQYDALYRGDELGVTIGTSPANKPLNRFANITVYDDNRIVLRPIPGQQDCQRDYVNASYVDGYSMPHKFIATQGPLPKTVVDFWRLVWQERPTTIVMVTNLKEGNKIKCQQYWPETRSKNCGPFQVTITDQQTFADYAIRTFKVALSGSSERPLKVTQFHFTAWPDHGVPDYATPILAFYRRVKSHYNPSRGPLLVHCSAGVGRTGTYITIDHVLEQVEREGVVDIANTVGKIRQQRMRLVQTLDQYVFIHDAILESVTCGDTQIPATDLRTVIHKLAVRDRQTRETGFQSQFHVLNQVTPKPTEVNRNAGLQNADRNRSMDYLPPDKHRVLLRGELPDYIHATSANGYKEKKAFIITQGPLRSTCRDFWKTVYDKKCGAIVMLSNLSEGGEEVCHQYWPTSGVTTFGQYTVDLLGEEKLEGFALRSLSVLEAKSGKAHQVTQFHIMNWAPDGRCSKLKTVTDVIEEVAKVQRRTGNKPIIVHCSDTVSRSGMFCAIATTIERCKTEGVVDVFQVVKALRIQKPGAVLTVDQYRVVFEAVLVFLDSFATYANFQDF